MKKGMMGIVAAIMILLQVSGIAQAKGTSAEEALYRGQAITILTMGKDTANDFAALLDAYDGSPDWTMKVAGITVVWTYLDKTMQDIKAPSSMKGVDKHMKLYTEHMRVTGELFMQFIATGDETVLAQATDELQAANDELDLVNKELDKANS